MMPHIRLSVSHASGYAREIYLSETVDEVLDGRVAQPQADRVAALGHRSHPLRGHTELLCERRHGSRALRRACDDGPPVRLAEEEFGSRELRSEERRVGKECRARWWA